MVVIKDTRKTKHKLEELTIGEYFMFRGDLYVVIADVVETKNACDDYYESNVLNILELKSGVLYRMNAETIVNPVDVEITVS